MVMKKHLTPIGKGGIHKHQGKGSQQQPLLPSRNAVNSLSSGPPNDTMNNYAKADPLPQPSPNSPSNPTPQGLGTGGFPGIGM